MKDIILDNIFKEIKKLPVFENSFYELQKLQLEMFPDNKTLKNIIESDPYLTLKILKLPTFTIFGIVKDIKDINQIISLFGSRNIINLLLNEIINKNLKLNLDLYNLNEDTFRKKILIKYKSFENISVKNNTVNREMIFVSFIMDIGKSILSNISTNKDKYYFEKYPQYSFELLEKKVFDITSEEISFLIIEEWGFSSVNFEILKNFFKENSIERIILKVINYKIFNKQFFNEKEKEMYEKRLSKINLSIEYINEIVDEYTKNYN